MVVKALLLIEQEDTLPLPQLDVLGAPLCARMTDALQAAGVSEITVVTAFSQGDAPLFAGKVKFVKSSAEALEDEARQAYATLAEGADAVLLGRLNRYCELDWRRLFAAHAGSGERVTRAWASATEPLDVYVTDPRFQRDVEFLFHSRLLHTRLAAGRYQAGAGEYVHPLRSAADLREIAEDGLHLRCGIRPVGREVRPGVWLGERARVDAGVRLVAPLYIGKAARVRTGAVITRGSALEHHSAVDCGTVIESSTVLPFAVVGAGLDLAHTVVGAKRVFDIKRRVAVEIHDPALVSETAHNAGVRVLAKAAGLAAFVPLQFWRGLTQRNGMPSLPKTPTRSNDFAPGVINEGTSLRPELVMERYGNQ